MERVKRWMCTLLAVCVILTLLPVTVAAEDPNGEQEATQPVARLTLNEKATSYTSLLDAVADAQKAENAGCTVTLLENVELGSETLTVTEGRFTLDLNGKSIQAEDKIKQNAMGLNHTFSNTVLEIAGESAVSLTVLNSDKNSIAVLGLTGANGGTVMYVNNANAALTIGSENSGQIRLENIGSTSFFLNVWAGTVTCYTGIFPHIALNNDQDLNDLLPVGRAFHYCKADGTLVTSGWRYGIIDGYGKKTAGGSFTYFTVVAHEHAFSDDNKCACGLVMDEPCPHPENRIDWVNGKCGQCQAELQAQLTTAGTMVFYPLLTEAVTAAQEQAGCTVKVLRDMNLGANTLTVREGRFTLDLNGKTVTADEQQVGAIPDSLQDFGTVLSVEGGEVQLVNTVENTTATLALNCVNGSTVNVSGGKLTVGSRKDTGGQIRLNGGTMMYRGQGLNWSGGMVKCYSGIFQNFRRTEDRPLCDALPAGKLFHYCDKDGMLQHPDNLGTIVGGPVDSTTSTIRQNYIIVMTDSKYTPVPMGDVNGDGAIDVLDIACLYTYLTAGTAEKYRPEAADVNGDDTADVYDLQMLYEFIRGIRTTLPE